MADRPNTPLTRDVLMRIFFFAVFAILLYQLFRLAEPFFTAILGAAILAMMFIPLHRRLVKLMGSPGWAALLSTFCVLFLAVLPLVTLGWLFLRESVELVPAAQRVMEEIRNRDWPTFESHLPRIMQRIVNFAANAFTRMDIDI